MGYTDQYQWFLSLSQLLLFDFHAQRTSIGHRHVQTWIFSLKVPVPNRFGTGTAPSVSTGGAHTHWKQ